MTEQFGLRAFTASVSRMITTPLASMSDSRPKATVSTAYMFGAAPSNSSPTSAMSDSVYPPAGTASSR